MSILTVNISSEVEQRVRQAAAKQNVTVDDFVDGALKHVTEPLPNVEGEAKPIPGTMSGAEMLAYWESVGAFITEPTQEDSVDIVNRMRQESSNRWKS